MARNLTSAGITRLFLPCLPIWLANQTYTNILSIIFLIYTFISTCFTVIAFWFILFTRFFSLRISTFSGFCPVSPYTTLNQSFTITQFNASFGVVHAISALILSSPTKRTRNPTYCLLGTTHGLTLIIFIFDPDPVHACIRLAHAAHVDIPFITVLAITTISSMTRERFTARFFLIIYPFTCHTSFFNSYISIIYTFIITVITLATPHILVTILITRHISFARRKRIVGSVRALRFIANSCIFLICGIPVLTLPTRITTAHRAVLARNPIPPYAVGTLSRLSDAIHILALLRTIQAFAAPTRITFVIHLARHGIIAFVINLSRNIRARRDLLRRGNLSFVSHPLAVAARLRETTQCFHSVIVFLHIRPLTIGTTDVRLVAEPSLVHRKRVAVARGNREA